MKEKKERIFFEKYKRKRGLVLFTKMKSITFEELSYIQNGRLDNYQDEVTKMQIYR